MDPEGSTGRLFAREEAEALLPEVDRLLARAQELAELLGRATRDVQEQQSKLRRDGHLRPAAGQDDPAAERTRRASAKQLAEVLQRVQRLGVLVRDVRSGLVDFPARREDRLVYLCWRRGEPLRLRWWHEVDAGFAGRQPLDR